MILVRYYYRSSIVAIIMIVVRRRCCCRVGITEHPIGRGHKFRVGCTTGVALVPFGSFSLATTQSWHITSTTTTTTNNNITNHKNSTTKCMDSLSLSLSRPPIPKKNHTHTTLSPLGVIRGIGRISIENCVCAVCVCVCAVCQVDGCTCVRT